TSWPAWLAKGASLWRGLLGGLWSVDPAGGPGRRVSAGKHPSLPEQIWRFYEEPTDEKTLLPLPGGATVRPGHDDRGPGRRAAARLARTPRQGHFLGTHRPDHL